VDVDRFGAAVYHSLDRKVCNTLNVCCIPRRHADRLVPVFLDALERSAARRAAAARLHIAVGSDHPAFDPWFARRAQVVRADGVHDEPAADLLDRAALGTEWEWEESPEVSVVLVDDVDEAVELFNRSSPRLVVSLVSDDDDEQEQFWSAVDSPFVGNGFTRWVDGQYALGRPELGLSNWENGRLFGRGGVLSGDSVFTVRTRVRQADPDLHR
jgi:glutamate-5-semialdehyde dehydrogenase